MSRYARTGLRPLSIEELVSSLNDEQLLALLTALEDEDLAWTDFYDCVLFCAEIRGLIS